MRRSAAALALSLCAACGGGNKEERRFLAELRAACAAMAATPTTLDEAQRQIPADAFVNPVFIAEYNCAAGYVPPLGSPCPSGGFMCRATWEWFPRDSRLCGRPGDCTYRCFAYAPGTASGLPAGTEVICASESNGP
jgi:hypothetical protein